MDTNGSNVIVLVDHGSYALNHFAWGRTP